MTLEIMRKLIDDVVLVSHNELRDGVFQILKHTHNLAEGAGAAAYKERRQLQGKTVVGILSGGNLDLAELPAVLKEDRKQKIERQALGNTGARS